MNTKTLLKFTFIALLLTVTFSCKKENTFTNFKYADKPETITCEGVNNKLLKEALYSFEADIFIYYKKNRPQNRLNQAYSQFIRNTSYNGVKFEEIASPHTIEIFEALKNENELWDANNPKSHLNYNSAFIECISNNIKDQALKTTFNALLSTNSLSPKLFSAALSSKYTSALSDKYLATYIALDFYYSKLYDVDLTKISQVEPEQEVDFNKIPK
ncbi:hypothetical protein Q4566_09430 [Tamlana sp. 2_MG-2023]|uniref:hypothetical protein n=1 Tax=unclassified Tamlana TaxID=2614803 RepID=UPI0026E22D20|nr:MULTISPECIES: hypothetical protein [unclassified Tamlana]MDO6760416.1 hypothetical protein [Tamlana sp. 2_MG-2023]MDO6789885.1 hypothetical protein [Tamlana sp. 1_MG-2023]